MHPSPVIELTQQLIEQPSVTPQDYDCQNIMSQRLQNIGFETEIMQFGDVKNIWSRRNQTGPLFVFAGHTDVVPAGDSKHWDTDPFQATIKEGMLYGRGAADMKGSLAAMIVATERFVADYPNHQGSIAYLITSDEEGIATDGTVKVVETLQARHEKIDWCLVGEPSSTQRVGDVIKNGRRGSITGHLTVKGIQGHVAYPHLAENPVHKALRALAELAETEWDQGNAFFPATSFQIANANAGTGASNVIPGEFKVMFNFRFSTEVTDQLLRDKVETILNDHQLNYDLEWALSGQPFLTASGALVEATQQAIQSVTGYPTELSTAGGTSDGRFIAPTGAQVIELGPCNATIHKVNECVSIADLDTLCDIYYQLLVNLLANNG